MYGHWHSFKLPLLGTKGMFQTRGNTVMHGAPVEVTWTELEHTAYHGDFNITARVNADWKPVELLIFAASDAVVTNRRLDQT